MAAAGEVEADCVAADAETVVVPMVVVAETAVVPMVVVVAIGRSTGPLQTRTQYRNPFRRNCVADRLSAS